MKTPTLSCPLEIRLLLDAYCYPKPLGNGSPAAEKAIRKLLKTGAIQPQPDGEPGRYETTELGRCWIDALKSVPCPAPEVAPLGENVTRDGRRARVICIDAEGPEPVVALVQMELGSRNEVAFRCSRDGSYQPGAPHPLDLVGHRHHEIQPPTAQMTPRLSEEAQAECHRLLDAVKHCWAQMDADVAYNDLHMRRTPSSEWTSENLKLARKAHAQINLS